MHLGTNSQTRYDPDRRSRGGRLASGPLVRIRSRRDAGSSERRLGRPPRPFRTGIVQEPGSGDLRLWPGPTRNADATTFIDVRVRRRRRTVRRRIGALAVRGSTTPSPRSSRSGRSTGTGGRPCRRRGRPRPPQSSWTQSSKPWTTGIWISWRNGSCPEDSAGTGAFGLAAGPFRNGAVGAGHGIRQCPAAADAAPAGSFCRRPHATPDSGSAGTRWNGSRRRLTPLDKWWEVPSPARRHGGSSRPRAPTG